MKNRIPTIAALAASLAWTGLARAQSPAPTTTPGKIGVINIQAAIANTTEGKKALADLQAKYQPRQQELTRQQQEIQQLQDDLQKKATTLSDEEQLRMRRQIDEKTKTFNRVSQDFQEDFRTDRQDFINRVGQRMLKIIENYAQKDGYALIMDANVPVTSADNQVLDGSLQFYFVGKDVNVTDEIVKLYDAEYPAGSTTKPALSNPTGPATRPSGSTSPPRSTPPTTTPPKTPTPNDKPKG